MSLRLLSVGFLLPHVLPVSSFYSFGCFGLCLQFPAVTDARGLCVNIKESVQSLVTCVMVEFSVGKAVGNLGLLLESANKRCLDVLGSRTVTVEGQLEGL